jgi:putative transposase
MSYTSILPQWASVPKSTFYYRRSNKKRGRRSSETTLKNSGEVVDNREVVTQIEESLSGEFCCYGYKNACECLRDAGFIINEKKVYRLIKEHNLLFSSKIGKVKAPRMFVRYSKIEVDQPFEYLCMDIKYIHIHGAKRNVLLLTVIDVNSRNALTYMLKFNIRKEAVVILLSLLFLEYKIAGFTILNDNRSQFVATMVRDFLKEKGVIQEFTHVATPEENSYIEAFHSIVQREVVDRFGFESFHQAKLVFYRYYELYNNERKHGSLGRLSLEKFLKERA